MDVRENSNTQFDFLEFVLKAILSDRLVRGDYLIVDNAAVHGGDRILANLEGGP